MKIRLGIVGSRNFYNYEEFGIRLHEAIFNWNISNFEIISGGAQEADSLAERFAKENNIPIEVFRADWNLYGKRAGPIRNKKIVENSTHILTFPSIENSPGTMNTISLAKKVNLEIIIVWV